jgi:hypothetical protein
MMMEKSSLPTQNEDVTSEAKSTLSFHLALPKRSEWQRLLPTAISQPGRNAREATGLQQVEEVEPAGDVELVGEVEEVQLVGDLQEDRLHKTSNQEIS